MSGQPDDPLDPAASEAEVPDREDAARERDERAAILKRRAIFVASAIAGLTFPSACADAPPHVCLEFQPVVLPTPPSATGSARASASADGTGSAAAPPTPRPCLDMPPPQPCLEMAPLPPPPPPQACLNR